MHHDYYLDSTVMFITQLLKHELRTLHHSHFYLKKKSTQFPTFNYLPTRDFHSFGVEYNDPMAD